MSQSIHVPSVPIRVVTATSLFDGHDAAINIMRRMLQAQGAEVIHLGPQPLGRRDRRRPPSRRTPTRWPSRPTRAATSSTSPTWSTTGRAGLRDVQVFGGGGGVIVADEIDELEARGVAKIFSPADGQRSGWRPWSTTIAARVPIPR